MKIPIMFLSCSYENPYIFPVTFLSPNWKITAATPQPGRIIRWRRPALGRCGPNRKPRRDGSEGLVFHGKDEEKT